MDISKKKIISKSSAIAFAVASIAIAGCDSTTSAPKDTTYIQSTGTKTIASVHEINVQDWSQAADQLVSSLLESGVFERTPADPDILVIGRIINDTTQQVDTDLLTKKMRIGISSSGKALTTTSMGYGGKVEDEVAAETAAYKEYMGDKTVETKLPTMSLTGKLLESRSSAGNVRQSTYTFQMSLTEIASGLALWEDEVQITKQGKMPSVGW